MKPLRWGIIGCGDVCEKKAGPALYGVDGSELVGVMRRTAHACQDYAKRHSVGFWTTDRDALLARDDINAIYVATPNDTHEEPVLAAAAAGKHVLVEKPMGRDTAGCDAMIDACQRAGVILAVAYYRRGYPTMLRAKQLIDAGAIGPVREIRINDEFPLSHRLDLVHFFAGDAESVFSREEDLAPGSHAERGPVLYVRTLSGAMGVMNVGWDEKLAPETVRITGEAGLIDVDDLKGGSMTIRRDGQETRETFEPLPATHWGLVANFVDHVNAGTPLACNGVEGRKSTVILDIVNRLEPDGPAEPVASA
jgi:predicted dehydrogenase